MTAAVTVCVPVYNGARFVAETLESLRRQTLTDFKALVSIDLGEDASVEACRPFCHDPRFHIMAHKSRKGWVGNCNFLISLVETDYFCILPHDDLLEAGYLAEMSAALVARPFAVAAYSDIATFEGADVCVSQQHVGGDPFDRVADFLAHHFNVSVFRGMIRKSSAFPGPYLEGNRCDDFAADSLWALRLAYCGDFVRVAKPLYRKRIHAAAETQRWWRWSDAQALSAWIEHCAACGRVVETMDFPPGRKTALRYAALTRLMQGAARLWPRVSPAQSPEPDRLMIVARYMERIAGPELPPAPAISIADPELGLLASARLITGKGAETPETLRRAVAVAPQYSEALHALSNALLQAGELAEPLAASLRAGILEGVPDREGSAAALYSALVRFHLKRGDGARALAAAELWVAAHPHFPAAQNTVEQLRAAAQRHSPP